MRREIYETMVDRCGERLRNEIRGKVADTFLELEKKIGAEGFDASRAGNVFESGEIQKILPLIMQQTQGAGEQYRKAFMDAGMTQGEANVHWMAVFGNLKIVTPRFEEIKADEAGRRIVKHEMKKEYKEVESDDKLSVVLPVGGAVIGGTIGGLLSDGTAAVITGTAAAAAAGIVVGAAAGLIAYKITIQVQKESVSNGKKTVEILTDTYKVEKRELQKLCREEQERACRIIEEWLDGVTDCAKNNVPEE